MDKNAIKKYAVWARRELISRVSQKALRYGITEKDNVPVTITSVNGVLLSAEEVKQRKALIERIHTKGYEQVMEEVAYTWFNRFIALRFMEVNGYLPSRVRVFTDENNAFHPQILTEAISLEMDSLDMEKVYAYKDTNDDEGLFKYLIIVQCNALSSVLPGMFQRISDYTELLFPDNLLRDGSTIEQLVSMIPEEDWKDAVQIIGWLYQYYNSEKKDEVFAALKKNIKITKDNIPAATQLFTPDWIVRYMVENSLGRLWVEGHPNDELKASWKYYLEEAEQEPEAQIQLAQIRKEYVSMTPEKIKCIDPCAGSGHILAYLFDVLMQIYEVYGYTTRDAVHSIIENHLYGLDIDDRAAQLAYFAVMMKARQYDRRFLSRKDADGNPDVPQPHVYAICESNGMDRYALDYFVNGDAKLKAAMDSIIKEMRDAKEYGSILNITPVDFSALYARFNEVRDDISIVRETVLNELLPLVQVADMLAQKYHAVVTNPPYMGSSGMSAKLSKFVKDNYPDSKSDLFAVFIEKCGHMVKNNCYQAMITLRAWLFLGSFGQLLTKVITSDIICMAHLGARAFEEIGGEVVQTTSFLRRKTCIKEYRGIYCRLVEPTSQKGKEDLFLTGKSRYVTKQKSFSAMPNTTFSYWASPAVSSIFEKAKVIGDLGDSRSGMQTGDNNLFLRLWFEVALSKINFCVQSQAECEKMKEKWIPQPKGGSYRKWYGNLDYVVNYEENGRDLRNFTGTSIIKNPQFYFREGASWSHTTSSIFSARFMPAGCIFNVEAPTFYPNSGVSLQYILGFLNTTILNDLFGYISQSMHFLAGDMAKLPIYYDNASVPQVERLVREAVALAKNDWDVCETSWDFTRHPLISVIPQNRLLFDDIDNIDLAECYTCWENECTERFSKLKATEEGLNHIFIDIYGLQDELSPEVEDKDISVRLANKKRDVKSLISYAVGCMFGRYSLDVEGIAYAGGEWDVSKYTTFPADRDNIIPICNDEYFEDDIVGRFIRFIETVYGKRSLDSNLRFIADALGGSGQPKDVIRNYFLNDFYADHCATYSVTGSGKRPIYWLFDSGKKNGFKALVYMHRYQPDTIARMRTDYVHEQQSRYRTSIADLELRIAVASTSERVKLNKKLKTLREQATEIQGYEEKIHHLADQYIAIDLDDGVKVNYAKFQDVLAKIK